MLEKEIKMYVDVMSKYKNSKAVKMINSAPPLTFSHKIKVYFLY